MGRTNYLRLTLPDDYSSANWSDAINQNFRVIERTIQDIRSNLVNEVRQINFESQTEEYRVSGVISLLNRSTSNFTELVVKQTKITAQVAVDVSFSTVVGNDGEAILYPIFIGHKITTQVSQRGNDSIIKVVVEIDPDAVLPQSDLYCYVSVSYIPDKTGEI